MWAANPFGLSMGLAFSGCFLVSILLVTLLLNIYTLANIYICALVRRTNYSLIIRTQLLIKKCRSYIRSRSTVVS